MTVLAASGLSTTLPLIAVIAWGLLLSFAAARDEDRGDQ